MFLDFLTVKERENFLELTYLVANCDKNFHSEEKKLIEFYKKESSMPDYTISNRKLDDILDDLNDSSFVSKTSILLEILSLVLADLEYDGEEQKIIKRIREKWQISDNQFIEITHWLKDRNIILKAENL